MRKALYNVRANAAAKHSRSSSKGLQYVCPRPSAANHRSIGPSKDISRGSTAARGSRLRLRREGRRRHRPRLGSRSRPQSFDPCFERLEGIAHTSWVLQGTPRRHRTGTTPRNHLRARCKGTQIKIKREPFRQQHTPYDGSTHRLIKGAALAGTFTTRTARYPEGRRDLTLT